MYFLVLLLEEYFQIFVHYLNVKVIAYSGYCSEFAVTNLSSYLMICFDLV